MNVDGTNVRRVSPPLAAPATYGTVSWVHDGALLVTVYRPTLADGSDKGRSLVEFTSMAASGEDRRVLYAGINAERPDASPVGDELVYEQERGAFQSNPAIDLMILRPAVLSTRTLTHGDGEYVQAAWSRDGSAIAYACAQPRHELEICVMQADGSRARVITHGAESYQWPTWSPDGNHLAFFSETHKNGRVDSTIGTVDLDGRNQHSITGHSGIQRDETPSWSPSGQRIAFQTDRLGNGFRIATMNVDGSDVRILTH